MIRYQLQVASGLTFGGLSLISMIGSFMLVYNEEAHLERIQRRMKKLKQHKIDSNH